MGDRSIDSGSGLLAGRIEVLKSEVLVAPGSERLDRGTVEDRDQEGRDGAQCD